MSTATVASVSKEALPPTLQEVFRAHYELIYRTAYSVTGSRQDAEDVLQTIFLRLMQREIPLEFTKSPRSYLYRAAVNLALNTVRTRKRHRFTGDVDRLEAVPPRDSDNALQQHLVTAISQLNPAAVEMLILRYEHNCSDAEIAKLLHKSRGTVAVTLYRARARLKKLLRAASGEDQ